MKQVKKFLVSVLLIGMMVGCADTEAPESEEGLSGDTVSLRYMIWDKNQEQAYKKIAEQFMSKHTNISVDMQVVSRWYYWEKLMTDIAGGSAPDIFWGHPSLVPSLVEREALLPLNSFVELSKMDLASMNTSLVEAFEYKGERYGIPKDWDISGMFYNKKLLKKAGYKALPNDLAWNTEDGGSLVELLQTLTLDKNGKHPNEEGFDPEHIEQYGLNFSKRGDWEPEDLIGFIASNQGEILQDGLYIPDKQQIEAVQFLHDLVFKYHVAPEYAVAKTVGSDKMFFSSQSALWITSSSQMIPMRNKSLFEWGIAPLPAGPKDARVVPISGVADHIYVHTKHAEEAWLFVQYINSKEAQDVLGETGTVLPMNKNAIQKFITHYQEIGIDPSVLVEEMEGNTITPPIVNNYLEWIDVWYKHMGLVFSGEVEPKSGIEQIVIEGNSIIQDEMYD